MNKLSDEMMEKRKATKPPADYPTKELMNKFQHASTVAVAAEGASVVAMDVSLAPSGAILVATSHPEVKVLDQSGSPITVLPVEQPVSKVKFAPDSDQIAIIVARDSQAAQVWDLQAKQVIYEARDLAGPVTDLFFTPLRGLVALSDASGVWALHDYERGEKVAQIKVQEKITAMNVHPDGLIYALGLESGKVQLFDIKDNAMAKELEGPAAAPVERIEFSNKGTYMAVTWKA